MKLVYVLPKYDVEAGEHVYHKYQLLSELGKRFSLAIVVEKCKGFPAFQNAQETFCVRQQAFFPRFLETLGQFFSLRARGYKTFFVHYSFFGAIAARLARNKVFYWNCGLPHLYFKHFGQKGWLKSKLNDDWPLRLSLMFSDYLVTGTPRMKRYYHEHFNVPLKKILIVPNQIDLKRFKAKKSKNKVPTVLFVHRISERKGAHHLVPIAKKVLKKVKAKFIIAGDGPYLPKLQALIRQQGLSRSITVLGNVPNKQIPKLYADADVFLMPSDEEGFPNVLLEAMATGTPFVASDVGGVRDIISRSAQDFVVQKGDVSAFAEKLAQLLTSSKLRTKLGKQGLQHVKRYDVKKVVQIFVKALKH